MAATSSAGPSKGLKRCEEGRGKKRHGGHGQGGPEQAVEAEKPGGEGGQKGQDGRDCEGEHKNTSDKRKRSAGRP
ncbi:MAG TPA: hypothetical protein GX507_11345 [Clostridia bacterium]|nr:hypothetical protein [Clostridia bacterium]